MYVIQTAFHRIIDQRYDSSRNNIPNSNITAMTLKMYYYIQFLPRGHIHYLCVTNDLQTQV